jgi:hypothetical protein
MRRSVFGFFLILLLLNTASAYCISLTDQEGDLLNKNGKPTVDESYLDIIEANLELVDDNYIGLIRLRGDIPSKTSESDIFVEWDFMIDADKKPSTSPWGHMPLLVNDLGVDYMARLCLQDDKRWAQIYNAPQNDWFGIDFEISGNKIELIFTPSEIGGFTNFDFVILVRKYSDRGVTDDLIAFDKAPSKGHYAFEAGLILDEANESKGLPDLSMDFTRATIHYNKGNEEKANETGEAFEYAFSCIQQDFSKTPTEKLKIYVYRNQTDLANGLVIYSWFKPSFAKLFENSSAPRPLNNTIHIGPQFSWHHVAHEITHLFIEEYSGEAYLNIKWLDEGLAEYEAWKCISSSPLHSQEAETVKNNALDVVNQLKNRDALYQLSELATEEQWIEEMKYGNSNFIHSQSFLVVTYLVSNYGIDKVKLILEEVQNGATAAEAVENILLKTENEIIDNFKEVSESEIFKTYESTPTETPTPTATTTPEVTEEVLLVQEKPAIGIIEIGIIAVVIIMVACYLGIYFDFKKKVREMVYANNFY